MTALGTVPSLGTQPGTPTFLLTVMVLNKKEMTMKKFFHSLMVLAAAATAFASCTKEVDTQDNVTPGQKMKTITVKTDIGTRTTLDANHQKLVWSSGDKLTIFNDADNSFVKAEYPDGGGDLTVSVPTATQEIYAYYPHWDGNTNGPESVSVNILNAQTQKNPGELNGYNYPMVAKGTVTADNKALISLYPVASALALNIYHTGLEGTESVLSVKVTPSSTSNPGFVGSQTTDLTGDNIQYTQGASSAPITVTLTNALALGSVKPTNPQTFAGQIYVCLAKQSYANVTFEIKTTKGTYTITSNETAFDCVNNDFVPVNINLARASFEEIVSVNPTSYSWTLVKGSLALGDKVVIAAAGDDFAMSTTQNNNNRGQIAITKSDNSLTAVADVQVFEVVAGTASGSFALKCLNGSEITKFITAASSKDNYLRSVSSIDNDASWSISINSDSGVATAVAQGSNTRNTIRHNPSNNVFSCYGSGQNDIVFYRAGLPYADLSFPEESYTVNLGETFTAPTLTNPHSVTVTYSSSNPGVADVNASTGEVTLVSAGTAIITASFVGNDNYSPDSASYTIKVVDPDAPVPDPETIIFANLGLENGVQYSDPFNGGNFTVTFGGGGNDGKYYTTGSGIRTYQNGTITVASADYTIVKIEYTFSTETYAPKTNGYSINIGSLTPGATSVWTGTSKSVVLTKTSNEHWRLQSVKVTYGKEGGDTPSKTLSSITVTPPTKTAYTVGEAFDATGMVVTATYSDATTADVTSSVTTDFATQVASAGNKTVTVTYTEDGTTVTGSFAITVSSGSVLTVTFTPGTDTGETTVTKDGITVAMTTMNNASYYQVYANQSMTVSSTSHTIIGISFSCTATGTAKYGPGNASANVGSYSYSGNNGNWSGSASSVTISSTAQIRMTTLTITYQ